MSKQQLGTTLLEVLITLLVVSIGLLGMASFQLRAVKLNAETHRRLQALNLAYEISDSIAVNSRQAANGDYTVTLANQVSSAPADSVADRDVKKWLAFVATHLPNGDVVIDAPTNTTASGDIKTYNIAVCWDDNDAALATPNSCGAATKGMVTMPVSAR